MGGRVKMARITQLIRQESDGNVSGHRFFRVGDRGESGRRKKMDRYTNMRELPLIAVLFHLGVREEWKDRKGGLEHYGRCPLHQAKKNNTSFSFHQDGRFQCFSCGKKGRGAIDLVMAMRSVGFQEAVEFLDAFDPQRDWVNKAAKKPQIKQLQVVPAEPMENPPFKGSYDKFFVPSEWLAERGFSADTLQKYGVGQYDNPARRSVYRGKILLPVRRWDGELVAYLARDPRPAEVRGEDPKYIWPKGFQKHLEVFGGTQLKEKAPHRVVFVVESPFTVLSFSQHGFAAVSVFGWSVSEEQAAILGRLAKGCIFLPDRDKESEAARFAGIVARHCWVKMPKLPSHVSDPEQLQPAEIRALLT